MVVGMNSSSRLLQNYLISQHEQIAMNSSLEEPRDAERPASIVCIAYRQLSTMTGIVDPTEAKKSTQDKSDTNGDNYMVCTRRLLKLPPFTFVSSTLCNAYTTVKESHESVTAVLNNAEDRLKEGMNAVAPFTDRVASVSETPLKFVDNLVCMGFVFFEEKLPYVTRNIREILAPAMSSFSSLFSQSEEISNENETKRNKI